MTDKELAEEYREFHARLKALDEREDLTLDDYDSMRSTLLIFIANREKKMVKRFLERAEGEE